jgi:hypothetical protein
MTMLAPWICETITLQSSETVEEVRFAVVFALVVHTPEVLTLNFVVLV